MEMLTWRSSSLIRLFYTSCWMTFRTTRADVKTIQFDSRLKIMSRKSLPKKDQVIWYLCAKCNSNIYVKDREQHSEYCPAIESTTCTIIRDKQLLSAQLIAQTITDELRGLNAKHLNNLVFLSESVFGLCDFVLGDNVLISSDALPNGVPIVRSVWPTPSSSTIPTLVSVVEEGICLFLLSSRHISNVQSTRFFLQNSG